MTSPTIEYMVNPELVEAMAPHTTDGTPCWCKKRVSVLVDGEKVGTASINHIGMMTATISSEVLAKKFQMEVVESISISTNTKAPEAAQTQTKF